MSWLRRKIQGEPDPQSRPERAPDDSPEQLRARIVDLVGFVNRNAGQLPGAAVVRARMLTDTLSDIVDTSAVRPLDVYAAITVKNTVHDYLPTTLQRYLSVPEDSRDAARAGGTPSESLIEQLDALQTSASAVLVAAQSQDVDALMAQGRFLVTKFSGSDLDL